MGLFLLFSSKRAREFNSHFDYRSNLGKQIEEYLYRDHDNGERFIRDSLSDEDFFAWVEQKKSTVNLEKLAVNEYGFTDEELQGCKKFVIDDFASRDSRVINGIPVSDGYEMFLIIFAEEQLFVVKAYISLVDDINEKPKITFHEAFYEDITGISIKSYPETYYKWDYVPNSLSCSMIVKDTMNTTCDKLVICVPDNDIILTLANNYREGKKKEKILRDLKGALRQYKTRR